MEYQFRAIEQKWQAIWKERKSYKVSNESTKPKCYVLDMFPYPSGAGLHVGHPLGYIASDIQYPKSLVTNLNERATKLGFIFLVLSVILCLIVIISIDNTIRLAMFSNRFLIKTMQMVGATRNFISKPLMVRALINGLISALVSICLLVGLIQWTTMQFPQLGSIQSFGNTVLLFGGLILIGVGISVFSTYRSVLKYLKMKLDELY